MTVTPTYLSFRQNQSGVYIRRAMLKVSGLTSGAANTIAHGLPSTPQIANYVPLVAAGGFETSDPDATNLYYTTGSGETSLKVYLEY